MKQHEHLTAQKSIYQEKQASAEHCHNTYKKHSNNLYLPFGLLSDRMYPKCLFHLHFAVKKIKSG